MDDYWTAGRASCQVVRNIPPGAGIEYIAATNPIRSQIMVQTDKNRFLQVVAQPLYGLRRVVEHDDVETGKMFAKAVTEFTNAIQVIL